MYKRFIKRFLDIVISIIALPFFFILLVILIPIIYFSDKGSVFYNAPRLGKNGKVFKMYKFRTMKMNAPDIRNEDGSTFNAENDPRLTRIGKLLRKTSVDEIPQLLNVFIGNMSLIGPRPDLPEHEKLYEPREKRKLEVRPGITGLNQAYYRNAIPWKERIAHDIEYIDKLTFNLDFKIFLKTILVIIKRDNVFVDEGDSNVSW